MNREREKIDRNYNRYYRFRRNRVLSEVRRKNLHKICRRDG